MTKRTKLFLGFWGTVLIVGAVVVAVRNVNIGMTRLQVVINAYQESFKKAESLGFYGFDFADKVDGIDKVLGARTGTTTVFYLQDGCVPLIADKKPTVTTYAVICPAEL